jgi:beta-ureidopropionase / N-carbamoyl-L-amino-acid hydrolase
MASQTDQRINGRRLWDSLMAMARIGATPKGGVRRLALSEEDGAARDRFRLLCEEAGLKVRVDAIGNMFAHREGRNPNRRPVLFGSHLDSQPSGGKFDGAFGVLAGLEVMRSLNDLATTTEAPLELVNWTDEEGSRFGQAMMGSGVWSGRLPLEAAYALADADGTTVQAALDRVGYRGAEKPEPLPADSYFELHIEQGPILENEGKRIGVVTGAQAIVWYDANVTGQEAHAGTTPPSARKDALVTAARIIELVDRMMRQEGETGRGTVGELHVEPNSRNVIPGKVRFSVEFRHPDTGELDRLDRLFQQEVGAIARSTGAALELKRLFTIPAQAFDPDCLALVREATRKLGLPARDIVSGAGHDAVYVARTVPTAMIFTPCEGGLSHNEAENISPDDASNGCQTLFETVVMRANRPL